MFFHCAIALTQKRIIQSHVSIYIYIAFVILSEYFPSLRAEASNRSFCICIFAHVVQQRIYDNTPLLRTRTARNPPNACLLLVTM